MLHFVLQSVYCQNGNASTIYLLGSSFIHQCGRERDMGGVEENGEYSVHLRRRALVVDAVRARHVIEGHPLVGKVVLVVLVGC